MSKPVFEEIFTFSGRRNRFSYNLFSLAGIGIFFFLVFTFIALLLDDSSALAGGRQGLDLLLSPDVLPLVILGFVPYFGAFSAVTAQRCRDIGLTGWATLLVWIPYLGMAFTVALMLIPGTRGANRYGPDPLSRGKESFDGNEHRENIVKEESRLLEKSDCSEYTFNPSQKKKNDFRVHTEETNFSAEEKFSGEAVFMKEKPHSDEVAEQNGAHPHSSATRKVLLNESSPDGQCGVPPTRLKTRRSNRYRLIGSLAIFISIAAVAAYALTARVDLKSVLHSWLPSTKDHNIHKLASSLFDVQNIGIYQNALEKKYGLEPLEPFAWGDDEGDVYTVDGCNIYVGLSKSKTVESIRVLLSDECRVAIEFPPNELVVINELGLTKIAKKLAAPHFEFECLGRAPCSNMRSEPIVSVTAQPLRFDNGNSLSFTAFSSDINSQAFERHAIRLTGLNNEKIGLVSTILKCTDIFDSAALELLSDVGDFNIRSVRMGQEKSWAVLDGVCDKELEYFMNTYPDVNVKKIFENIKSAQQGERHSRDEPSQVIAPQTHTGKQNVLPPAVTDGVPFSPSFDCNKASNGAERLICSDRDLTRLDIELSNAYRKVRDVNLNQQQANELKDQQLQWIKHDRNKCLDKQCMENTYKKRISQLEVRLP